MNNELLSVLDYLQNERHIDRETLLELVEESLLSAARRAIGPANDLRVRIDPKTGDIKAWAQLKVVERVVDPSSEIAVDKAAINLPDAAIGDDIEWEVTPRNFGRIAAQNAKQTMMYRLRQAEKAHICEEYEAKMSTLVSGVVSRVDRGDVFVEVPGAEAVMPHNAKIPGEDYQPGDHFTGLLVKINPEGSGPSLILSRTHPQLVACLFEREVTEIAEGVVEIMAVAREPGYRSKLAVRATSAGIDPVGACVGLRGSRVKTVIRELAGEKVDIIRWDEQIKTFVSNALQPAKLASAEIDEAEHSVRVIVPDDQLSLAIGKKGQNARLAAKLTGWRIDIQKMERPEDREFADMMQRAVDNLLKQMPVVSRELAAKLVAKGFLSVEGILAAEVDDLAEIDGVDPEQAAEILAAAKEHGES